MNINDLNENQLNLAMNKADNTIKAGQTLTWVGTAVGVVGSIIYFNNLNKITTDRGLNHHQLLLFLPQSNKLS